MERSSERSSDRLFFNIDAFSEQYLVPIVQGREAQLAKLRACVAPAFKGAKPLHTVLSGPAGTGKTLLARSVLEELKARGIATAYINCMEQATFYAVLDKIIIDNRILRTDRISTTFKLEQVGLFFGTKSCVVVLDEIDRMVPKERTLLLYNFANLGKMGLICICSSALFLPSLDESVRSRLSPTVISLPPYTTHELQEVLRQRSELGLVEDALPRDVLSHLAQAAAGDARTAVQVLRQAAVNAGQKGNRAIEEQEVHEGWKDGAALKRDHILSLLGDHQRLLLRILEHYQELTSVRLREEYAAECVRLGLQPIAERTFLYNVNRLVALGLAEVRRVRGNVRMLRFVPVNRLDEGNA